MHFLVSLALFPLSLELFPVSLELVAGDWARAALALAANPPAASDASWQFSSTLFSVLIHGALIGTVLGLVTLVYLILRDRKDGKIW